MKPNKVKTTVSWFHMLHAVLTRFSGYCNSIYNIYIYIYDCGGLILIHRHMLCRWSYFVDLAYIFLYISTNLRFALMSSVSRYKLSTLSNLF